MAPCMVRGIRRAMIQKPVRRLTHREMFATLDNCCLDVLKRFQCILALTADDQSILTGPIRLYFVGLGHIRPI
jgi:hypothetical protein